MGFNVSGHDVYSLIVIRTTDYSWINGSSFGFEGSILSVGIQVLIILGIGLYYRQKKAEGWLDRERVKNRRKL